LTCRSLINLKEKEEPKIINKPGAPGAAGAANKNKRKRIAPKPGTPRPPGVPNPNKITQTGWSLMLIEALDQDLLKGIDLLLLQSRAYRRGS
jgi:hypothetical protein